MKIFALFALLTFPTLMFGQDFPETMFGFKLNATVGQVFDGLIAKGFKPYTEIISIETIGSTYQELHAAIADKDSSFVVAGSIASQVTKFTFWFLVDETGESRLKLVSLGSADEKLLPTFKPYHSWDQTTHDRLLAIISDKYGKPVFLAGNKGTGIADMESHFQTNTWLRPEMKIVLDRTALKIGDLLTRPGFSLDYSTHDYESLIKKREDQSLKANSSQF